MNFEIERKFLVCRNDWEKFTNATTSIRQAYLTSNERASVRIRIKDERVASITIKSREAGLRRLEMEYPIPVAQAEALMDLRQGSVIEKVRHLVPWQDLVWEVDKFTGDNSGLIIAEIELHDEQQRVELPTWIGAEITGQPRYYNNNLAQHPYCAWPRGDRAPMEWRG
jgi:adenylate cyclase